MVKQHLSAFFGHRRLYFVCGKVYKDLSYANKIVHWFVQHRLPVMPVTPTGGEVDLTTDTTTQNRSSLNKLPIYKSIGEGLAKFPAKDAIDGISVCFVTPPQITMSILQQLETDKVSVQSVWFQPGSWDLKCVKRAEQGLKIESSKIINDCILVNGAANASTTDLPFEA
ncbi:LANO_0G13410g1_1 [Lachancea nothofagi CBS 11611]|uniref:LANO_0G13410g1_1 n=1 Tax=Lachancea nothofagi CBS 11611 TaxID=1266666 RepID=A0A1G4KK64_9SACH|nr:LANO_0G13410g1_1 [Lachancea nothofagi CBS 11611]